MKYVAWFGEIYSMSQKQYLAFLEAGCAGPVSPWDYGKKICLVDCNAGDFEREDYRMKIQEEFLQK